MNVSIYLYIENSTWKNSPDSDKGLLLSRPYLIQLALGISRS